MEDKYLELLNSELSLLFNCKMKMALVADELEAQMLELRKVIGVLSDRCEQLKQLRADHLCPFKPGDRVKGWDYFDKEKTNTVTGIYPNDTPPFYVIEIDRDGEPFKLLFDSMRVEPADVDGE